MISCDFLQRLFAKLQPGPQTPSRSRQQPPQAQPRRKGDPPALELRIELIVRRGKK